MKRIILVLLITALMTGISTLIWFIVLKFRKLKVVNAFRLTIFCFLVFSISLLGCWLIESKMPTYPDIDEYKFAEHIKYNSLSSENGLAGDVVYVKGTVIGYDELEDDKNGFSYYLLIENKDKEQWLVSGMSKTGINKDLIEKTFIGQDITAFGVYVGYSRKLYHPGIAFTKITCKSIDYFPTDFEEPVEEVVKHCSFDSFALEVFETGANCDIVSHETIEKDNGDFEWKIVIENVVDFNALMESSALVGAAVNQNIQWTILQDGAQPVKSVMISIGEDGKAILMFLPPIGYGNLLMCVFVATDSYDRKEEASDAYINSPLYEYDILKSLEN